MSYCMYMTVSKLYRYIITLYMHTVIIVRKCVHMHPQTCNDQ